MSATLRRRVTRGSLETPVGRLELAGDETALRTVSFARRAPRAAPGDASAPLAAARSQLEEYFAGERERFEIPLHAEGTPFELAVWGELARIPFGETRTYGEVAAAVGRPDAARAVGVACARNPLAIVVPCHRVVGADGRLVGYGGGIENKVWLVEHEGALLARA
ncbi:MAG TPA: methylated-DNA--[protein]-cysteine S-methyltransferase [Solirubrobacteraceae bacterium]|nr:methylated-DNA--[protein]-cysteine S-methyltransferase [Solirubrobacteraceae bacterium]